MILLDNVLDKTINNEMFLPGILIFLVIIIPVLICKIIQIIKDKF